MCVCRAAVLYVAAAAAGGDEEDDDGDNEEEEEGYISTVPRRPAGSEVGGCVYGRLFIVAVELIDASRPSRSD